jgi:hypothetical protein
MAGLCSIDVVPSLSGACVALLVMAETLGGQECVFENMDFNLAMDYFAVDLDHLLVCLVVLWAAVAVTVLLWWLIRGLTIWMKQPPKVQPPVPIPQPTIEEQIDEAKKTFEARLALLARSGLPKDASKQAEKELEMEYLWNVAQLLGCTRLPSAKQAQVSHGPR